MEYILTMTFICASGDKKSLSVDGVKPSLTSTEVRLLMDTIIEKAIFQPKNGALTEKYSAQITQRQVTKLEIK